MLRVCRPPVSSSNFTSIFLILGGCKMPRNFYPPSPSLHPTFPSFSSFAGFSPCGLGSFIMLFSPCFSLFPVLLLLIPCQYSTCGTLELQTGSVRAKFSCNLEEHSDSHKQNISSASRSQQTRIYYILFDWMLVFIIPMLSMLLEGLIRLPL